MILVLLIAGLALLPGGSVSQNPSELLDDLAQAAAVVDELSASACRDYATRDCIVPRLI
jgi:hypothetical protein